MTHQNIMQRKATLKAVSPSYIQVFRNGVPMEAGDTFYAGDVIRVGVRESAEESLAFAYAGSRPPIVLEWEARD